ncbi:hypothetical protein PFISCL1PPCAC_14639, partial [Pristionchus fissidentatus]
CIHFLLLPLIGEGVRISHNTASAACSFPSSSPVLLAVSSDASIDTLIYRAQVSPPNAILSLASVTSTKLPHINYTNRFELSADGNGEFSIRTKGRLSLPPYPSETTSAHLYLSVVCNDQVFPLLTLRLDGGNRVAPRFYGMPYSVSLPRKSAIGTEVNTGIIAIDWDPAISYGVHFSILDDWAPFSLVVRPVSSSSPSLSLPLQGWSTDQFPPQIRLKVIGSIDHLPNEFDLNITAIDNGEPMKTNSTKIHVTLLGDYRPLVRDSRVRTLIGESVMGDQLVVIPSLQSVVDEEIGPVTYSFVDKKMKDYFEIDSSHGSLTLIFHPPLTVKSMGIMVTSSENPPRSSIVEVTLQRDSTFPRFSSCDFSVSLPENSRPGTHVFQMHVIDRNEDTRIHLIDPDETFSLDTQTGVVTVQDPTVLDSERFDLVQFVIQIDSPSSSSPPPGACQKARVTVHLIDENDNSPLFEQLQYAIRVISPLPNNTLLGSIRAIDNDKDDNGRVEYRLIDSDNLPIRLVSVNGTAELIYSHRPNTRPLIGRYYVTLEAVDHGEPQRSGRAIIEIEADDLSGVDGDLEKKLREEEKELEKKKKEEKRVAKVAIYEKNEEMKKSTVKESTTERTTSSAAPTTAKTTQTTSTTRQTTTAAARRSTSAATKNTATTTTSAATEKTTTAARKSTTANKNTAADNTTSSAAAASTTVKTTESKTKKLTTKASSTSKTTVKSTTTETTERPPTTERTMKESTRTETEKREKKEEVSGEIEEEEEENERPVTQRVRKVAPREEEEEEDTVPPVVNKPVKKASRRDEEEEDEKTIREDEEIVSRFHRDEQSTTVREIFAFHQPAYEFELFGEFKEGEILGRVSAAPDALFYGIEKKAAPYFKIDGEKGEIIVLEGAEKLKEPFNFTVSSTNGEFMTESLVSVSVDKSRSLLDSAPTFDQSIYSIHVTENEEPKPLTTLRAYHRSLIDGSSLIYSLLDDGANVPFYLDEKSAQLVLLAPLDHERTEDITFKISACLSSNPSSCGFSTVKIFVDDVNDNPPIFEQRQMEVKLPSDLPKGSPVAHFKATDRDSNENGEISYAINPPSNTFAIDIDRGDVITLGPLEHSHYEMAIQAFDHGNPRRSDIGRLTVNVQGTNPSAPQFDQFRYDISLSGPVKTGERVVSLHASDPDPGEEGIVSYRFGQPKNAKAARDQGRFSINPHTGAVTTLTTLNSFDGPFLFVVEAIDNSPSFPRKSETLLRIQVEGEPALRFFALPSTLFISSNKGEGSVILRASASSSEGTPITFSLSPPSDSFSMEGPNLIVSSPLKPKEYNITIRADTEEAYIDHTVNVIVMTNRDKYPVFSRLSYELPISLDDSFPSVVHTFEARVQTGSVEYSLFPPKKVPIGLSIDKHTGALTVTEDFISSTSNTDTVFTVVRAWNSEFPQFHSDVGVILTLDSPSAPFGFPLTLYRTIIRENTPVGTLLNSSVAIAPMSLRTGVEYGITPSDIIGIHSNGSLFVSGLIDLEALTVDEDGSLTYTIWAESGDERAVSTLNVKIVNVNEFTPVFRQKTFRFNVDESSKPGSLIGRIVADDANFGEKLIYSMKSESREESIEITPNGSILVGRGGIDFDSDRAFDIVVSVEDSTGQTDEVTVEVRIVIIVDRTIKVENDSPIMWNMTADSLSPLPITAVDSTEKDSIDFKIIKGNERGFFALERVNETAALLKPTRHLPSPSHFTLTINAVDSTKTSTSRVIVNVLPSPSTTRSIPSTTTAPRVPIFAQGEYAKALKDDTPVGNALISVQVWSPPQDGEVQLSSNCSFLNVKQNGVVLLSAPIPLQSGEVDCGITATTTAASTTVNFHILVLDSTSSNHAPIFDRSTYTFNISTESFASMIGKIEVHDEDGDEVTLEIQPPEYASLFELNEQNELELRFPASTLTDQNVFSFIVVASDNGKPKQTAIANVKVLVVHGGKKGGFFPIASSASTNTLISPIPTSLTALSTPKSSESVEESTTTTRKAEPTSQTVLSVRLVTNDFTTVVPPVEEVTENIEEVTENIEEVTENTSESTTEKELEVSTVKTSGNEVGEMKEEEKQRDETTTTEKPKEVEFTSKEYRFEVKKDARVGTIIGAVKVDGLDSNTVLEYMVGDERVVRVDERTGEVSLTGPVIPSPYHTPVIAFKDGRIISEAQLVIAYSSPSSPSTSIPIPFSTVTATTKNTSRPSSHSPSSSPTSSHSSSSSSTSPSPSPTPSIIRVEGGTSSLDASTSTAVVSSTTPSHTHFSFSHSSYTASMPEGAYKNGALVQLQPANIHTNGKDVTFALVGSDSSPFVINESTGELAMFGVDREEKKEYDLLVKAFDYSSNEEATAVIHVDIVDVNDNSPIFESVPSIIGVRRDMNVGTVIGKALAVDKDDGENGVITYSIQPSKYFGIDHKTASIIVRSSLLSIPEDQLTITVVASDGGRPAMKAETQIELRLFSSIKSPTLPRPSTIAIPKSSTIVANLLAAPNVGDDQSVTYTLEDDVSGLFSIDRSGVLSMIRTPKQSEVNVQHNLKITATNSFGSASTEIGVTVVDGSTTSSSPSSRSPSSSTSSSPSWEGGVSTVNTMEGVCMFPVREYRVEIKENLSAGTPVVKVSSDCEAKELPVKYSLAVKSDDFSVEPSSGEIRTLRPLDREDKAIHLLVVNVTKDVNRRSERETNTLRSRLSAWQTVVIIRVIDDNDSTPEWKHLNGEGKVVASMDWKTPIGSPLMRIHASDKDEKKTRLKYSIEGETSPFSINETSGLIYLEKSVENDKKDMYSMTGVVSDGRHISKVPIEIYRLSTQYHLVKLTSEVRHVDINAKKLEEEINNGTSLNLHILSKQPFVDANGVVDPKKSFLFVYALDGNHVPKRGNELLESLSPHSALLYQTSGKISSFSAAQPGLSLSYFDLFWIVFGLLILVALFITCCVAHSVLKRRRLRELEKEYMVDGMRPRPYDVENIPRSTAQTVLSSRRMAEAIPSEDRLSRTSNRSDTTFVFANSVKDENSLRRSIGRS